MIDYHTHSFRCGHASGEMEAYVERAVQLQLAEVGLTDHLYLYFQDPENRSRQWAMPEDEFPIHHQEMCALRERHRASIAVRVAVEADYVPGFEPQLEDILNSYSFDYVLGGVHFLDEWMIDDAGQCDRFRRESTATIYRRYYAVLRQAIESCLYDVIAHFDLPKKFGFVPEEDVAASIAETLDAARDCNVAIEISSAGLRKPVGEIYPSPSILREIARRGLPVVLSSDAHDPTEVGFAIGDLIAAAKAAGIERIATFHDRRMELRSLF